MHNSERWRDSKVPGQRSGYREVEGTVSVEVGVHHVKTASNPTLREITPKRERQVASIARAGGGADTPLLRNPSFPIKGQKMKRGKALALLGTEQQGAWV